VLASGQKALNDLTVQTVGHNNADCVNVWVIRNCAPVGIVAFKTKSLCCGLAELGVYVTD
jgi:hypothetical protein